ncbi:MAG: DUF2125 domain-containing protein [Pseudomonadota bacterium]
MARWTLIAVVAAALLWSGWWFVGARATETAVTEGLAQAEAQGWRVERADLSVAGFPNRFDVTLTEPRITAPAGWALAAPILRAFALSYRPNHVIAVAPPEMVLTDPTLGDVDITSDDLRASLIVSASTQPVLDRATLVAEDLGLAGAGWTARLDRGQVATRQAAGPTVHDIAVDLVTLALPAAAGTVERVDLDATVTLDRAVGAGAAPRLDRLELRSGEMVWGDVSARMSGEMSVMSDGTPRGAFSLRLTGWERLLDLAVAGGLLPEGQAPLITAGLRGLSDGSGEATVPVEMADGQLLLLGFPIAPLPRLPVPGR